MQHKLQTAVENLRLGKDGFEEYEETCIRLLCINIRIELADLQGCLQFCK